MFVKMVLMLTILLMLIILLIPVIFLLKPFINRKTVNILMLVIGLLVIREITSLKRIYRFELNKKEKTYSIELYKGKSENVKIPSKYKNKKVTIVGSFAFYDELVRFARIKKVKIPNTIKKIEDMAFYANFLEKVIIPDSVVFIDYGAFSYNLLKNIEIGNSVTYIEGSAFSYNNLKKVIIPNSVKYIGKNAFANNKDLIIYGILGSEAEKYAENEGIQFIEIE